MQFMDYSLEEAKISFKIKSMIMDFYYLKYY